ncbi:hypothetical protein ES703_54289 [subsurface metagenome]
MPNKGRRGQSKRSARGKKRGIRQDYSLTGAQRPDMAPNHEPVPQTPTPSAKVLTPRSTLSPVQHPYIITELRRIAILAGIMLATMVVLHLVIS